MKTPGRWGDLYCGIYRDVYELIDWGSGGFIDHPGTKSETMFPAQELADRWVEFLRSKGYVVLSGTGG
jgi:hypothetical protein